MDSQTIGAIISELEKIYLLPPTQRATALEDRILELNKDLLNCEDTGSQDFVSVMTKLSLGSNATFCVVDNKSGPVQAMIHGSTKSIGSAITRILLKDPKLLPVVDCLLFVLPHIKEDLQAQKTT